MRQNQDLFFWYCIGFSDDTLTRRDKECVTSWHSLTTALARRMRSEKDVLAYKSRPSTKDASCADIFRNANFIFDCVIDMRYSYLWRQLISHVKRLQQWARCYFCDPFWTISSSQYASKAGPVAGRVIRQTGALYFHDTRMRQSLARAFAHQMTQTSYSFIVAINL